MILQPRAIPEAIESLNSLDIEKVWFRGLSEPSVCKALNQFVENTDYDYYWIIADDVIVDGKPLEVLRPLLQEGKVATGYCKLSQTSEDVNLTTAPMEYTHYEESDVWDYYKSLNRFIPNSVRLRKDIVDYEVDDGRWWENLLGHTTDFCYSVSGEVQNKGIDVFKTYFAGWSFTGASRQVWMKYPFMVSVLGEHSDTQFALRYVNRDGQDIYTHKDSSFIHLKEVNNDALVRNWLVGVERPVVHIGQGVISLDELDNGNILWEHDQPETLEGLTLQLRVGE